MACRCGFKVSDLESEIYEQFDPKDSPELAHAREILPAWFVDRMMADNWLFGLMMTDGTVIGIQCINRVTQSADGTIWLDVELINHDFDGVFVAPTIRLTASINASHVMAAFELADT